MKLFRGKIMVTVYNYLIDDDKFLNNIDLMFAIMHENRKIGFVCNDINEKNFLISRISKWFNISTTNDKSRFELDNDILIFKTLEELNTEIRGYRCTDVVFYHIYDYEFIENVWLGFGAFGAQKDSKHYIFYIEDERQTKIKDMFSEQINNPQFIVL